MPCRCEGYEEEDRQNAEKKNREIRAKNKALLDEVTQNLCWLCGELEYKGWANSILGSNTRLRQWWKDHQDDDAKRVLEKMRKMGVNISASAMANKLIKEAEAVHPVSSFHRVWFLALANKVSGEIQAEFTAKKTLAQKKSDALNKLTDEERKLLGLK